MTRFEVWAPSATRVDLVIGDDRVAMQREGDRYGIDVDVDAPANTRYGFSLDGGEARPDPRSPHQPDGVHALSATVDHTTFEWAHEDFVAAPVQEWVIYELHIGTFSTAGTYADAIEHLDHLVDLGVTTVEVMPVNSFSGRWGWGYDGVALYAPHEPYGAPDDLKAFVDACHGRGLAVILDVVYNHFGPDGNYLPEFGPYLTDAHKTPWGPAVNFAEPEVRRFVIDNAVMWLRDYHFDGLRLDAVHALVDDSPRHILAELAAGVRELPRLAALIAESEDINPKLLDWDIDAQWHDAYHHAIHAVITGERAGYYASFGSVADIADALAVEPAERHVVFLQNHDQVGNRAAGERLSTLIGRDLAAVVAPDVLLGPFIPLLFQGEEWAASTPFLYFTDFEPGDLAEAVRRGRREEFAAFGWRPEDVPDPQDPATYRRSQLDWAELDKPGHREMLALYKRLIALRRFQTQPAGR